MHAEAVWIPLRRFLGELLQNRLQLGIRLLGSHSRANLDRRPEVNVRVEGDLERQVDVRLAPSEPRRHHPRDQIRLMDELDSPPGDGRVALKVSLPESVTE